MIDVVIHILQRMFEKDERSRKFAVQLADSYLRRIRRFQDQLVLLGISLNFLASAWVFALQDTGCRAGRGLAAGLVIFLANLLLGRLYTNEHRTTKLIFARYPELELVMEGDKSWSNSRMLARAYKYLQSLWMIYSAYALAGFLKEWPLCL